MVLVGIVIGAFIGGWIFFISLVILGERPIGYIPYCAVAGSITGLLHLHLIVLVGQVWVNMPLATAYSQFALHLRSLQKFQFLIY